MNPVTYLHEWRALGYGLFALGLIMFTIFSIFLARDAHRRGQHSRDEQIDYPL